MTQIDQDDLANREARMLETVLRLAAEHDCTVIIHEDEHWFEINGPEENQVALAIAMADSLEWCAV